jgi:hypothetical protein
MDAFWLSLLRPLANAGSVDGLGQWAALSACALRAGGFARF